MNADTAKSRQQLLLITPFGQPQMIPGMLILEEHCHEDTTPQMGRFDTTWCNPTGCSEVSDCESKQRERSQLVKRSAYEAFDIIEYARRDSVPQGMKCVETMPWNIDG